jgi:hypothetical protein
VKEHYSSKDTLYIGNILLCSHYQKGLFTEMMNEPINQDSIFNIFLSSLEKLSLPIKLEDNITFYCDSSLNKHKVLKIGNIDSNLIYSLVKYEPDKVSLIPYLRIFIRDQNIFTISPFTGFHGGGIPERDSFVGMVIFLVKNEEIIYSRMWVFTARTVDIDAGEEPENTIEQKHWDKLVYKVMRNYKRRLR